MNKFMLIGGTGRSGTTVLCRSMARHPDLTDVPEWRFMTDPDGIVDFYRQSDLQNDSPFHFDRRLKRLEDLLDHVATRGPVDLLLSEARLHSAARQYFGYNIAPRYARTTVERYSPRFREICARLTNRLQRYRFAGFWVGMEAFGKAEISLPLIDKEEIRTACSQFLRDVAEDVCQAQGARFHLEKNTWNILWFDRIRELLPEAKMVHIYRDPRDVVSSYTVQPWMPDDYIMAARTYQQVMDSWWRVRANVPEDSYLELSLEELTRTPEENLRSICDFWDIGWSEALDQHGLNPSSFGRWERDIPAHLQSHVTEILEPTLVEYGYAR